MRGPATRVADSFIAGFVLVQGGTLYTRTDRHFARIDGLHRAGEP